MTLPVFVASPIPKQKLAEARALDPLQELLRNDLIRIDIGPVHRDDLAGVFRECFHALLLPLPNIDKMPSTRRRRRHRR